MPGTTPTAGKPPYDGASAIAVGFAHLMEPVPEVAANGAELGESLVSAIQRGLAKEPSERPQSVSEFRKALVG